MTALSTVTLYCDWHFCKEAYTTTEPEISDARKHAKRHGGWGFPYGLDLCSVHKKEQRNRGRTKTSK